MRLVSWQTWACREVSPLTTGVVVIDISKIHDVSVLHLYGEVSMLEMEMVSKTLESLKKYKHNKILLDLAEVDHLHFQAVLQWAEQAKLLRSNEGDLKLCGVGKSGRQVLQFTGADQHLKDYASISEAVLSFLRAPEALLGYGSDMIRDIEGVQTVGIDRWDENASKKDVKRVWMN